MSAAERRPTEEAPPETPTKKSEVSLPTFAGAWAVLVSTPRGNYSRRLYLSLHSASQAVERAERRGQEAHMILCRIVPTGDL